MSSTIITMRTYLLAQIFSILVPQMQKIGHLHEFFHTFCGMYIYQEKKFFAVQRLDMARPFRDSIIALCLALIFQNMLKKFHYLQLYTCIIAQHLIEKKTLIRHLSKQVVISIFVPIIKMFGIFICFCKSGLKYGNNSNLERL